MNKQTCQHCCHFVDHPAAIEAEFPYLTVFGSAYASARGNAGLCSKRDLFLDPMPAQECLSFRLREPVEAK